MDATQPKINEIEQKLKELTLELQKLKQALPAQQGSNQSQIQTEEEEKKETTDETQANHAKPLNPPSMIHVSKQKSQYKVIAMEYCQKMNLPKPIEECTENKDWNVCWNYLSPNGCSRQKCEWTHPDLSGLNAEERQQNAKTLRKNMQKTRYNAKVTINDKTVDGKGASKANAIYDAYKNAYNAMIIPMGHSSDRVVINHAQTAQKHPKSRLMEYTQKNNIPPPNGTTFVRCEDANNQNVWKATVVFDGKTVEMTDVRKKLAERKCFEKLVEMINC